MRELGIRLVVDDSQKSKFASIATAAQRAQADLESRLNAPLTQYEYALNRFGGVAARAASIGFAAITASVGGLVFAFQNLGKEFVNVNEKFGALEITLGSALRSITASRAIVNELAKVTATSPIPFQNLADIASSFAVIPQTSQQLLKQSQTNTLGEQDGFLRRAVRTVEAMRVFRPDQDEQSAIFAIREALGGQFRSLVRRFDIPTQFLQTVSKKSTQELKDDPLATFDAIEKAFTGIISPEAVSQFARQPSVLLQNAREQAIDLPLLKLGQEDKQTGRSPYQAMLVRAQRAFDDLVKFMTDNFESRFAGPLRTALSDSSSRVFDSLSRIVGKLLDIGGIKGQGTGVERIVEGIATGVTRSAEFLADLVEKVEKNNLVESGLAFVEGFVSLAKKIVSAFASLADLTTPGIALLAAVLSPALLNNFGTFFRTLAVTLPKIATGFGRGVFDRATQDPLVQRASGGVNAFTGGYAMLAGNRIGAGKDPFALPDSLTFRPPPTPRATASAAVIARFAAARTRANEASADYREAFLSNRNLRETLDPTLTRAGRNAAIERSRIRDIRFLESNPKAAEEFARRGVGGNQLVGISSAAAREEILRQNNPQPGILRRAGAAVGGAALGAATGLVAGGAIYLAVEGGVKLYEALTANTRATEENSRATLARASESNRLVFSEQNKQFATLLGSDPGTLLKEQQSRFEQAGATKQALSKLFETPTEAIRGNFADIAELNFLSPNAKRGTRQGDARFAKEEELVQRLGFNQTTIQSLADSGKIAKDDIDELTKTYIQSPVKALQNFRERLSKLPGGPDEILRQMDTYIQEQRESLDFAGPEGFQKLVNQFGEVRAGILRKLVVGTLNPDSVSEIDAELERSSGVQELRSRALSASSITQNTFVSRVHDDAEQLYQNNFRSEDTAEKLDRLATDVTETRTRMGSLLSDLDRSVATYSQYQDAFLAEADRVGQVKPAKEFIAKLSSLSPAKKQEQLRAQFASALASLDDSGQLFTTAVQAFVGEFQSFSETFSKLSAEQFEERRQSLVNLVEKGRLSQFLPASPVKSGVAIRAPLAKTEGTDLEVSASRIATLEDFSAIAQGVQKAQIAAGLKRTTPFDPRQALSPVVSAVNLREAQRDANVPEFLRRDPIVREVPTFASLESQEDRAARRTLKFNQDVTIPRGIREETETTQRERFQALGEALRPAGTFSRDALPNSPDIVRKLEEIGFKSDVQSRAFATLRERTPDDLEKQVKALELQKTLIPDPEIQKKVALSIDDLSVEIITLQERIREANFESALRGDSAFDPSLLQRPEDQPLARRLREADLSSTIEDRAKDELFPTLRKGGELASLDRQESILQIRRDEAERVKNTESVRILESQINDIYTQRRAIIEDQKFESFFTGLQEGLITSQENLARFGMMGKEIGAEMKIAFGDAFANIVTGTETVSEAFRNMAVSILKYMAQIFAQKAAQMLINMAFSAFSGGAGGTTSSFDVPMFGEYARGGPVLGGSGDKDDVPAMLMGGEYVLRKSAVEQIGVANLDKLNEGKVKMPEFNMGGYFAPEKLPGYANGGIVIDIPTVKAPTNFYSIAKNYATGGKITDGTGATDDVPAMLMGGEYVINKRAAQSIGYEQLDAMNDQGRMMAFSSGGRVPSSWGYDQTAPAPAPRGAVAGSGNTYNHTSTVTVNIDQNGKPQTSAQSSALDGKELAEAIDQLIEEKFQSKMRPGEQFNPV